jgi:hypothetical protein
MTVKDGKLVKKTEIVTAAEELAVPPAETETPQEEEASEGAYSDEAVVLPWEDEVHGEEASEGVYSDDERFAGKSDESQ